MKKTYLLEFTRQVIERTALRAFEDNENILLIPTIRWMVEISNGYKYNKPYYLFVYDQNGNLIHKNATNEKEPTQDEMWVPPDKQDGPLPYKPTKPYFRREYKGLYRPQGGVTYKLDSSSDAYLTFYEDGTVELTRSDLLKPDIHHFLGTFKEIKPREDSIEGFGPKLDYYGNDITYTYYLCLLLFLLITAYVIYVMAKPMI